jgi:hypothetical protein
MTPSQNAYANLNASAREHLKLQAKYEVLVTKNGESEKQFQTIEKKVRSLIDAFEDWQWKQEKIVSLEEEIGNLEAEKEKSKEAGQEQKTRESEYEATKEQHKKEKKKLDPDYETFLKSRIEKLKKKANERLDIERKLAVKKDHSKTAIQNRDQAQGKVKDLQNEMKTLTVNAINACKKERRDSEALALREQNEYQKVDGKLTAEDNGRRAKVKDLHDKLIEARDVKSKSKVLRSGEKVTWYPGRSKILKAACDDMEALVKRI